MIFIRNLRFTTRVGRRALSTTPRKLPIHALSLHRSFPYTLYKINPGGRSNIVDAATAPPRSKHFYDRDEANNVVKGRVYPTLASSGLSHLSLAFTLCLIATRNTGTDAFPPYTSFPTVV